ncbi:hypothetical protein WAI453_002382 [Rhynchosporium graminicola]|uniref:Uncharacterized protein n=1 Tax=Rhynchosporium graminicola TaxID=2792576 RepID=A0A1E1KNV1_9HELO|nr:uncharacterized protein RCO7_07961 [Rhynchosporium commune]
MGRQGYLTAMALGRGHFEDDMIETLAEGQRNGCTQQYNDRGHPSNPETRRREREHVRAANEVMQVTGVVEDSLAARVKLSRDLQEKHQELLVGLRLMEVGRGVLVGGIWGVMGLRRRILLYKPYVAMRLADILRQERTAFGVPHMLLSGVPTVVAYHISDWVAFFVETMIEGYFDDDHQPVTDREDQVRNALHTLRDASFCYLTLHLRLFAILQQLNLIPASPWLPSLKYIVPFSSSSPLAMPALPSLTKSSILSFTSAIAATLAPMLVILAHGKIKSTIARVLYSQVYRSLPRPSGESIFSGLAIPAPTMEYDSPDLTQSTRTQSQNEGQNPNSNTDQPTRRALEGLTPTPGPEGDRQTQVRDEESDEDEIAHATLISFDVEATEPVESGTGTATNTWSAELRSANEPKPSSSTPLYRVTGLTMLPTFMAAEGLREIAAAIFVMPLEAAMVQVIGRTWRVNKGLDVGDMYPIGPAIHGWGNLVSVTIMQVLATGVAWGVFTVASQLWVKRKRAMMAETVYVVGDISDD